MTDSGDWFGIRNGLNCYVLDFIIPLWASGCDWEPETSFGEILLQLEKQESNQPGWDTYSESAFKFLFLHSIYWVWKGREEVTKRQEVFLTLPAAHNHVCATGNSLGLCFSKSFFFTWSSSLHKITILFLFLVYSVPHLPTSWWLQLLLSHQAGRGECFAFWQETCCCTSDIFNILSTSFIYSHTIISFQKQLAGLKGLLHWDL